MIFICITNSQIDSIVNVKVPFQNLYTSIKAQGLTTFYLPITILKYNLRADHPP